jgi:hypothetical protein
VTNDRPTKAGDHAAKRPGPMRASQVAPETEQDLAAVAAQRAVRGKKAKQRALRKALDTPSSPGLAGDLERRMEAQRQRSAAAFKARRAAQRKLNGGDAA